jgi:nucleotide-binding universal stress UspA family protein
VARAHVDEVYVPLVAKAGFNVEAHVNVVEGHTSAASIAESIVKFAQDRNADILAVTSHGGYVLLAVIF